MTLTLMPSLRMRTGQCTDDVCGGSCCPHTILTEGRTCTSEAQVGCLLPWSWEAIEPQMGKHCGALGLETPQDLWRVAHHSNDVVIYNRMAKAGSSTVMKLVGALAKVRVHCQDQP